MRNHCRVEFFGVGSLALEQMTKCREVRIYRIEKPKISNVGRGKIRKVLIFLPASSGELSAASGKNLDQTAEQTCEVFARANVDQGRNEAMVQNECTGLGPFNIGDAQDRAAFTAFTFHQQT